MSRYYTVVPENFFVSPYFTLKVLSKKRKTKILMEVYEKCINTETIHATVNLLTKHLPTIFSAECFNEKNLPFSQEVKHTEVGHLFEHIILEYLCKYKLSLGFENVEFSGFTEWNWKKHPKGTFQITIDIGNNELALLSKALHKSILLLRSILESHAKSIHAYTSHSNFPSPVSAHANR